MSFIQENNDVCNQLAEFCIKNSHALFLCDLRTTEGINAIQSLVNSPYGKEMGATMPTQPYSSNCFYFTVPFHFLQTSPPAYILKPNVLNVITFIPEQGKWKNHYLIPTPQHNGRFFIRDDNGYGKTNLN